MKRRLEHCVPPFVVALILLLPFLPITVWADTKIIVAEGNYAMGDGETPAVAESRALHNAKRMAVEQAGTYIQSYTKTKNFQLTEDELQTITGALIEVEMLEQKRTVVGHGFHFYVKIKAMITTDKVNELVARLKGINTDPNTDLVMRYKEMQANYDQVTKEIDSLKQRLENATSKDEQKKTVAQIANKERRYLAAELDQKGVDCLFKKRDDVKARDYFSQAISQDPTYAESYFHRALVDKHEPSKFDQATADLTEAIRLDPQPTYYLSRAEVYLKLEQKEQALADLSTAVKLGQNTRANYYYYVKRGEAYWKFGQYELAIADFTEMMKTLPSDDSLRAAGRRWALGQRASAFVKLGKYQEAIGDYSEIIRLGPSSLDYIVRGGTYSLWGKHKLAFEDFTEAIRLEPQEEKDERYPREANPRLLRAWAAFPLGLMEQVIADSTEALKVDPTLVRAYWLRGKARAFQGQFELAIGDFTEAVRLKPNEVEYYTVRASVYAQLNRYEPAISDLTVAIRLDPEEKDTSNRYQMRGFIYMKQKKYELALADLNESLRIDPQNVLSYKYRAGVYGRLEKEHRGKSDLKKACELGDNEACDFLDTLQ